MNTLMNTSMTSQYMDKQIMDLSNSQSNIAHNNGGGGADFIDFMNRPAAKKDDMVPSYDFMPIRPTAAASSSSPKAARSNFDSDNDDPPLRTWNSMDSKANSSPIRVFSALYNLVALSSDLLLFLCTIFLYAVSAIIY